MPWYEFVCPVEGHIVDTICKMGEVVRCPVCDTPMERKVSATIFQLKGGGWAKDGYK